MARGISKFEFYDFEGRAAKESEHAFMDFEKINEMMLERRVRQKQTGQMPSTKINSGSEGFSMLTERNVTQYSDVIPFISLRNQDELYKKKEA